MATRIQLRRDTAANWASANPTLAAGEVGVETDTDTIKIGDGATAWNSLAYATNTQYALILTSTNTLTSQTAAQPLFDGGGGPAGGALTLPIGTYRFDSFFSLSSMSATSGSFGFSLTGGATFTQSWFALGQDAALATATTIASSYNTAANTALCIASTSTTGYAFIRGTLRVTAAGTVIPNVSLTTAAAAVVGAESYFIADRISPSATFAYTAGWS